MKTPQCPQKSAPQLKAHVREIVKLLYADAEAKDQPMNNLTEIEMTVRSQLLQHVSPDRGAFYCLGDGHAGIWSLFAQLQVPQTKTYTHIKAFRTFLHH